MGCRSHLDPIPIARLIRGGRWRDALGHPGTRQSKIPRGDLQIFDRPANSCAASIRD